MFYESKCDEYSMLVPMNPTIIGAHVIGRLVVGGLVGLLRLRLAKRRPRMCTLLMKPLL